MTRQRWMIALAAAVTAAGSGAQAQGLRLTKFTEDFEGVTLGDSVNERQGFPLVTRPADDVDSAPVPNAFTKTGPAGWAVDNTLGTFGGAPTIGNTGVPTGGVAEWEGWSFASKDFWIEADDQQRSTFDLGAGTVAVADPDEYYDLGDGLNPSDLGYYNTSLSTPSIGLTTLGFGVGESVGVQLKFDSSYRVEANDDGHPDPGVDNLNNQSGEVVAVFDSGEVITTSIFDSTIDADATNSTVTRDFFPTDFSATSVQFFYNMGNAGNDWWWAIDNIEAADLDSQTGLPLAPSFTENFEGVALGDSVNERRSLVADRVTAANDDADTTPRPDSWTNTPPAGWSREVNGPATAGADDNDGVYEWEGWSFASKDFWTFADQQGRETFDNASGNVAIADGDEWDDFGPAGSEGDLDTVIETPTIDISDFEDTDELAVKFDSSWRSEDFQTAIVTVDFQDGNGPTEILRWESEAGEFFKDDATNETVFVSTPVPGGATEAVVAFQYIGNNDWWWAIDNVRVGAVPEPTSVVLFGSFALITLGARRRG